MEKYSGFRDPGTGIQPFSTPIPSVPSTFLDKITLPPRYLLGAIRTSFVLALTLVYFVLVRGVCLVFAPVPPLYRTITHAFTSIITRLVLLLVGLPWISVEHVSITRGKHKNTKAWNPGAGDIIVSNWVSWVEVLWLAFRFNPIFVLPISEAAASPSSSTPSATITYKPGRRTNADPASLSQLKKPSSDRIPIAGFRKVSLLTAILNTGHVPNSLQSGCSCDSLEDIRKKAARPIVLFPECTTSNGKGMLRFANVFRDVDVPVKGFNIFIMCVRYDPPSALSPTLSHSIPSSFLNPLPHLYNLTTSLAFPAVSIRLLPPSESPRLKLFVVSEVATGGLTKEHQLSEACATLIATIGKVKKTGMGWEDKATFLDLHQSKRKP